MIVINKERDASHSFESYYKRALTPVVVLCILADGTEMYGYEITQKIDEKSGGLLTVGVLYKVLKSLTDDGYISISHSEIVNGRARQYYKITASGLDYVREIRKSFNSYTEAAKQFLDSI